MALRFSFSIDLWVANDVSMTSSALLSLTASILTRENSSKCYIYSQDLISFFNPARLKLVFSSQTFFSFILRAAPLNIWVKYVPPFPRIRFLSIRDSRLSLFWTINLAKKSSLWNDVPSSVISETSNSLKLFKQILLCLKPVSSASGSFFKMKFFIWMLRKH